MMTDLSFLGEPSL